MDNAILFSWLVIGALSVNPFCCLTATVGRHSITIFALGSVTAVNVFTPAFGARRRTRHLSRHVGFGGLVHGNVLLDHQRRGVTTSAAAPDATNRDTAPTSGFRLSKSYPPHQLMNAATATALNAAAASIIVFIDSESDVAGL